MNRTTIRLLASAMLLAAGWSQPPPGTDSAPHESGSLHYVDAVVIDSDGDQVTDLLAEDFAVLDDGKPQSITSAIYVAGRRDGAGAIAFVIDNFDTLPTRNGSVPVLTDFVERKMESRDLVSIMPAVESGSAGQKATGDRA